MALEDRIRTSVDQAVQGLVSEFLSLNADEVARQVGEAEQRLQAEFEQRLTELDEHHREQAAQDLSDAVQAEAGRQLAEMRDQTERQLAEAEAQADERLRTAVADAEARAIASTQASIAAARVTEREQEMAGITRLVESIRGLDGATSLSEVLDALALAGAKEAARAAVVVLKGDHIIGWRLSGFGARDAQPKSIDLPLQESGVIAVAVSSARAATTKDGETYGPGFEDLPEDRMGMAIPVLVGGRVVAVVYADGVTSDANGHAVPSTWPEVIEVLARHAGRCLEALTAQKAAAPSSVGTRGTSGTHAAARNVATTGAAG
jgi:hypothetical protein